MSLKETDEEIIVQYKNGDKEVFKNLINRYSSTLFNFSAHLVDKNNAPDIVQEIFIKVWKNLHKFDISKSSFKTWLFVIAKNTIVDFLRKKKNLNFSDLENTGDDYSFSETIVDENLLPDEALQKFQNSEFLNKLLDQLSFQYKTVLLLHYQEEMTFDEISRVLKKPLNTVKSYHHRAIIELRKMI